MVRKSGASPKVKKVPRNRAAATTSANIDGEQTTDSSNNQHCDPRPQSVLSLHSSLSNPDVPADDDASSISSLLSPLPDDHSSQHAASLEPIDEDYKSAYGDEEDKEADDDDNATTITGDTEADAADAAADAAEDSEAEEIQLQTKIADLRTRKEEMLNLVRELQTMNDLSSARQPPAAAETAPQPTTSAAAAVSATPARAVNIRFERIVPIEMVPAARGSKSTSVSPAAGASRSPLLVTNASPPAEAAAAAQSPAPTLKPLSFGKEATLNEKLSEINAMKQKLIRLQTMMNTVNSIEKQDDGNGQAAAAAAAAGGATTIPIEVQTTSSVPQQQQTAVAGASGGDVDSAEEELEKRVASIQSMTQDLKLQSATLAAERDRLRDIKNELARRNELKDNVLLDLEEHVGLGPRAKLPSGLERRSSRATRYEEDDEMDVSTLVPTTIGDANRQTFNDLGGGAGDIPSKCGFKKSLSEEPWRRGSESGQPKRFTAYGGGDGAAGGYLSATGHRVKSNAFADRYGVTGAEPEDLTTQTTSADDGSVRSEGSKFGGGSLFMPPPMRALHSVGGGCGGTYDGVDAAACRPTNGCCGGAEGLTSPPQCAYHQQHQHHHHGHGGGGSTAANAPSTTAAAASAAQAPHPSCFNDPVMAQQFIQTQQILINSVNQCNQLLWDQQRDINNLNSAVILLQERLLNFTNAARAESVIAQPHPAHQPLTAAARAESVPPPQPAYQHSYRAQSEQHHQQQQPPQMLQHQSYTPQSTMPVAASAYPRHYSSSTALSYAPQPLAAAATGRPPLPHHHHQHHHHQQQQPQQQHQYQTQHQPQHSLNANLAMQQQQPQPQSSQRGHSLAPPTQFPLPPPREFLPHPQRITHHLVDRAPNDLPPPVQSEPPMHTHHIHPQATGPYLNNNPNSPLFNGSPNPAGGGGAGAMQQLQMGGPGSMGNPPMFVYHNNNHSAAAASASNANNLGASNINSNHTIAANLNMAQAQNVAYGMPQQQQQQPLQQQQQQPITLNNQVPPGNRANNYWDNFRSYSRQNLLSTANTCNKSNENVGCVPVPSSATQPPTAAAAAPMPQHQLPPQQLSTAASTPQQPQQHMMEPPRPESISSVLVEPSDHSSSQSQSGGARTENAASSAAAAHQHTHLSHNILPVMDNKYFMHFRNQIHQHDQQQQQLLQQQIQLLDSLPYEAWATMPYDADADIGSALRPPSPAANYAQTEDGSRSYHETCRALINEHNKLSTQQHQLEMQSTAMAMSNVREQQPLYHTQPYLQPAAGFCGPQAATGVAGCGNGATQVAGGATQYPMDLNLSSRRMPEKPSVKLFDAFKDDVYTAVSQLIAANESRPDFLISLFRELQHLSRNDPLRARLLQAFEELEQRQAADDVEQQQRRVQTVQPLSATTQVQRSDPPVAPTTYPALTSADTPATPGVVDTDTETLIHDIVRQVEDFLHDQNTPYTLHDIDESTSAVRQRVATIAMRRIQTPVLAGPPLLTVTREQLLASMPVLDRYRPAQFMAEFLPYLHQLAARSATADVRSAATGANKKTADLNRRKRRLPQKTVAKSATAVGKVDAKTLTTAMSAAVGIVEQQQAINQLSASVQDISLSTDEAPNAAAAVASQTNNADLAEADQMCGGANGANGAEASEEDNDEEATDRDGDGAAVAAVGGNDGAAGGNNNGTESSGR